MSSTPLVTEQNAVAFAARGHAVLPLHGIANGKCTCGTDCGRNAGKHPHHLAPHGLKSATTDLEKVRAWFRRHPEINYGIVTDTLPTVDIDPRNGGDVSWRELVKKHHDVCGWRVRTGGGGEHIMLGTVSTALPSCKLAKGIEFQSIGKYIVGAGSMHQSGKRYFWDKSAVPQAGETAPQAPPPWLVQMLTATVTKPQAERTPDEDAAFFDKLLEPALPGERRHRFSQLLGHLFGKPYPHRGVLACLAMSHVKLTYPDLEGFTDAEMKALAQDLIRRDDIKRGIAA